MQNKYGWAWFNGQQKPLTQWREIRRGRKKGQLEILFGEVKGIIHKQDIIQYPKED